MSQPWRFEPFSKLKAPIHIIILPTLPTAHPAHLARRREKTARPSLLSQEAKLIQLVPRGQIPVVLPLVPRNRPIVTPTRRISALVGSVIVDRRRMLASRLHRRCLFLRRRHDIRRVAADFLRRESEQLPHAGTRATRLGTGVAHVVKPVDGGFGCREYRARLGRHVCGAEGKFEEENGEGAAHVVQQHPPHCSFVENGGVGLVENEAEGRPGGFDTLVRGAEILPFRGD